MTARDVFAKTPAPKPTYTYYEAKLQIRDLIVGGVPSDPEVIRKWLTATLASTDPTAERTARIVREKLSERSEMLAEAGTPVDLNTLSISEKVALLMAGDKPAISINGFVRIQPGYQPEGNLAYEGRCLKAALREWANSAYPGTAFPGKKGNETLSIRKGLKSTLEERITTPEKYLDLGVTQPTKVEDRVKRVRVPNVGETSVITRVEVIERPLITAILKVRDDFLKQEVWARIWEIGEEIGVGADRARSDGRFDLVSWTNLGTDVPKGLVEYHEPEDEDVT